MQMAGRGFQRDGRCGLHHVAVGMMIQITGSGVRVSSGDVHRMTGVVSDRITHVMKMVVKRKQQETRERSCEQSAKNALTGAGL